MKGKIDRLNFSKIKNYFLSKDTIKKVKNISTIYMVGKYIYNIYG